MRLIQNRPLCLASGSPRRKEMLDRYQLNFKIFKPDVDETPHRGEPVVDFCRRLAQDKAQAAVECFAEHVILAGDTVVYHQQDILGKPENEEHALELLQRLSGQTHEVYSGFCLLDASQGCCITDVVCTQVRFFEMQEAWLRWYIQTGEPMDKAGAYSIQGIGTVMVQSIAGSYNNVVGFPIEVVFGHLLAQAWIVCHPA